MSQSVSMAAFTAWLRDFATVVNEQAGELTALDAAIGDADHGSNLDRGMQAVLKMLESDEFDTPDALFKKVGMTLVSTVGGASGPLYGTFFLRFGAALHDKADVSAEELGEALRAGVGGVVTRGKATLGDKTMYDVWAPAVDAYDQAVTDGRDLAEALNTAVAAARDGRDATTPLVARKGRASYLGERSAGHLDPGAASTTMLIESAAKTLGSQ
ncbi:MAG: dihydroxyacetone kinase subunit DhaL [Nocardioidaceae bacterium]